MPTAVLSISLSDGGLAVGLKRHAAGSVSDVLDMLVLPMVDQHSEVLLPAIDDLLQSSGCSVSDLSGVAFDAGPGGFTRIRVACAVAQGVAFARSLPVAGIDSLAAIALAAVRAQEASAPCHVLVAMDARMGECYVAGYQVAASHVTTIVPAELVAVPGLSQWLQECSARVLETSTGRLLVTGDALCRYPDTALPANAAGVRMPGARDLIGAVMTLADQTSDWVEASKAAPRYVRNKVALNVAEQAQKRQARDSND